MTGKIYGEMCRVNVVSIDSYSSKIPIGKIYNSYAPDGIPFHGLVHFFKEMERSLDTLEQVDSPVPTVGHESPHATPNGALATFAVRVLFRQNASWQGCFTWLEGKQEKSFRSALELTMAINDLLDNQ